MKRLLLNLSLGCGFCAIAGTAQAATIDLSTWSPFGDVVSGLGTASLSSNALVDDDSPQADGLFNFSGTAATDSFTLEGNLGLSTGSLDLDPANFVQATEGSGLGTQITLSQASTLSFDWTFLTNDETFIPESFGDYAFVSINGTVTSLASTDSPLVSSSGPYARQISGTFSQLLPAGTYSLGLGVLDIVDFSDSSALQIANADLSPAQASVPEPGAVFGLGLLALGLAGKRIKTSVH